jgi:HD-GYP domain-containing protein (c-di-GMP phosphodiesterase class II)
MKARNKNRRSISSKRQNNNDFKVMEEIKDKRAVSMIKALQLILTASGKETTEEFIRKTSKSIFNLANDGVRGFVIGNLQGEYYLISGYNIDESYFKRNFFTSEDIQNCLQLNLNNTNKIYDFYTQNLHKGFSESAGGFIKKMGVYNDLTVTCVPIFSEDCLLALVVLLANGKKTMPPFRRQIAVLLASMIGKQYSLNHYPYERESLLNTIEALALAIEEKDPYTNGHSHRVKEVSMKIAKQMQFFPHEVEEIGLAGLLHDVGKIGIRESILKKVGDLTHEEYEEVKKHTEKTKRILGPLESIKSRNFIDISYLHHERVDGKGYPEGLKGDEIPMGARIISLADSYDAMMSKRPYKKEMSKEDAISEIKKHNRSQFDPSVVDAFLEIVHEL